MREQPMHEIVLPETKPALEWVNGRVLQKVSPQRRHALAQMEFATALGAWAREHGTGMVGTEWEFRVQPSGEIRRPLVPDVAYISYARLPYEDEDAADIPRLAPDAVVEVLSPGDRRKDVEEKIRVYLTCGTSVVFLVDTGRETVIVRDGAEPRSFTREDVVTHPSLPGFTILARTLFERPKPKPQAN
jgi:Uma2 family endonuclease